MKRNIIVFILLILLASSFKYRTKARESGQPLISASFKNSLLESVDTTSVKPVPSFEVVVGDLEKANQELANGNAELFKTLWSHSEDITVFDGNQKVELRGWTRIEPYLNNFAKKNTRSIFSAENIASHNSGDQAYLLQKEHYTLPNGKSLELHVTTLFRKENNTWKIIHRHGDSLSSGRQSEKSAK